MEIAYGRAIKSSDDIDRELGEKLMKKDNINPDHYKNSTSLECIESMYLIFGKDAVISFCICNAWKYIWRWKNKNGTEDLEKAKWYCEHAFMLTNDNKIESMINSMKEYISKEEACSMEEEK